MQTLTEKALNKMAQTYINSLSHVLYDLNGVERQTGFFKKSAVENIAQAYVFFDENRFWIDNDILLLMSHSFHMCPKNETQEGSKVPF